MRCVFIVPSLGLLLAACGYFGRSGSGGTDGNPGSIGDQDPKIEDPDLDSKWGASGSSPVGPDGVFQLQAGLTAANSCEAAAAGLRDVLLTQLKADFDNQIRYFQPFDGGGTVSNGSFERLGAPAESAVDSSSKSSMSGPSDFTTTNNQVVGVEEGDFVKNTGTHMFIARHDRVFVLKSWPVAEMAELATLVIGDQISEMLLIDGKTLVIAGRPKLKQADPISSDAPPEAAGGQASLSAVPDIYWPGHQFSYDTTVISIVDVSNPAAPRVTQRKHFRGSFQSFRSSGGTVRAVLRSYLSYPEGVQTYLPYDDGVEYPKTKEEYSLRLQKLYNESKEALSRMTIADFLTQSQNSYFKSSSGLSASSLSYVDVGAPEPDVDMKTGTCTNIYFPIVAPSQLALTRVLSLDLGAGSFASELILAGADTIYASKDSLYLAGGIWNWWFSADQDQVKEGSSMNWTTLHKFDLRQSGRAPYVASGIVPGSILNQFSLDEHDGVLRVAATESRFTRRDESQGWWQTTTTVNHITTLRPDSQVLKSIGRTPDLAPGESIFSARFSGTRGFVVTFRQVDPLFAVDLSVPEQPKVLGELKIPGFSNYMQFIDDQTLLTIGRDADPTTGRALGLKLSLFDVGNMSDLKETHSHIIELPGWASSEATYDHKAFTYFAKTGHLAIPVSHYNWDAMNYRFENGLSLFSIDKVTGITPAGRVDLSDLTPALNASNISWIPYQLEVRRSVFADDYVYAISQGGVKVAPIADPSAGISSVTLPCDNCDTYWWW